MTIELLCVNEDQAARLSEGFQAKPERVYNEVLAALLDKEDVERGVMSPGRGYIRGPALSDSSALVPWGKSGYNILEMTNDAGGTR